MPEGANQPARGLLRDAYAGATVALVAIPQCMAFAAIAGLPPAAGLYAAIAMGLVGGLISGVPKVNIGPVATTSSMLLAVLIAVTPGSSADRVTIAAALAVLVGLLTLLGAMLRAGQFVRFVPVSVQMGLTVGTAVLIVGSQLAPLLGVSVEPHATVAVSLWRTLAAAGSTSAWALSLGSATFLATLVGAKLLPRAPIPFAVLALGAIVVAYAERALGDVPLARIGALAMTLPESPARLASVPLTSDLFVGGVAIAFSNIIQFLTVTKAVADRDRRRFDSQRELIALGAANVAAGLAGGLPGTASFARSALNELSGAQSRLANIIAALGIAAIALAGAPLARYVSLAAIAGILLAVAVTMIDWRELAELARHGRHDRIVLATTILGVFVVPIHWAILIGLVVAIGLFLRRVSKLHVVEMVAGENERYHEQAVDDATGRSAIAMLQVEGPLFFAHADELAELLSETYERGARVIIIRMRRTQQIDYSAISAVADAFQPWKQRGRVLVLCGLAPRMRAMLAESALARLVPAEHMLRSTGEVFGSAHAAMRAAQRIVRAAAVEGQPLLRPREPAAVDAEA